MKRLSTTLFLSFLFAFPVGTAVYVLAFVLRGPLGEGVELFFFPLWPFGPMDRSPLMFFLLGFPYVILLDLLFSLFEKLCVKKNVEIDIEK